jgi:DNA-binding CsgD family transcriptional regulator
MQKIENDIYKLYEKNNVIDFYIKNIYRKMGVFVNYATFFRKI